MLKESSEQKAALSAQVAHPMFRSLDINNRNVGPIRQLPHPSTHPPFRIQVATALKEQLRTSATESDSLRRDLEDARSEVELLRAARVEAHAEKERLRASLAEAAAESEQLRALVAEVVAERDELIDVSTRYAEVDVVRQDELAAAHRRLDRLASSPGPATPAPPGHVAQAGGHIGSGLRTGARRPPSEEAERAYATCKGARVAARACTHVYTQADGAAAGGGRELADAGCEAGA